VNLVGSMIRQEFHRELDDIKGKVVVLFALVREGVAAATDALLTGDRIRAEELVSADERLDALDTEIEAMAERLLLTQAPMASEYHFLVTAMRIVPELERSGDLVEHIAQRAGRGIGPQLTPTMRGIVQQLGDKVGALWQVAATAFERRDPSVHDELEAADADVNTLARQLWADTATSDLPSETKMELALIARFYERLGDHACHITARIRPVAGQTSR